MDMYCSCPYAAKGSNCKHMAAVLYEIENQVKRRKDHKKTDIKSLIDGLTKEQLSGFLLELAETDTRIQNQLLMRYSGSISSVDVSRLKREVDAIIERFSDRGDYIDYYHALDFSFELIDFLNDNVSTLVDRKFNLQAFDVSSYIFLQIATIEIDDSDGGISQVSDTCCELWKKILQNCNDAEKEQIHAWLLNCKSNGQDLDYFQEYIDAFLINEFCDEKILKERIKLIDDILENTEVRGYGDEKVWDAGNGFHHPAIVRLDLMKKLGCPEDEMMAFRKKYRIVPEVRQLEILEYIEKEQWNLAISSLLESKETDKEINSLVSWYSEKLIGLYEKLEMQKQYKEELLFYVTTTSYQENLDYVFKLKNICSSQEWIACRGKILQHMPVLALRYELMKEEKMYDRLMQELSKRGDIYNIDKYESLLKDKYPEEVVGVYRDYLIRQSQTTHNRETYRQMMVYLKKISDYPQGVEIANQLALQ